MGQTLTHGVYLPNEGERNCYSGLASNWRLLDGAIGTVAAHTTAIAGKADISHSHGNISNDGKVGADANKPLITGTGGAVQAGSFGTSANTFCEGNDSRLSDARTPVAHTHGKADVTDLFNSANTWSQNQIFQAGVYFYNSDSTAATATLNLRNSKVTKGGTSDNGSQIIQFLDKGNKFLSQITTTKALSGTTQLQFTLGNIDSNDNSISGTIQYSLTIDGTKQFIPGTNNTHDLGNSSYQWNNLYAKNYYYNGVAWGLDKANVWSEVNKFTSVMQLQYLQSGGYSDIRFANNNNVNECAIRHYTGNLTIGKKYQSASAWFNGSQIILNDNGTIALKAYDGTNQHNVILNSTSFYPETTDDLNLGTSTNQWKSFNGVNPGALSLPDCQVTQSIDRTGWVYDGATYNTVLLATTDSNMTKNGWLYVRMANTTSSDKLSIKYNSTADRYPTNTFGDTGGSIEVFVPVVANTNLYLLATKDLSFCKFYPCLGNVPSGV